MQSEGWFRGSFKGRRMICLGLSGSGKIGPREKATGDNLGICLGLAGFCRDILLGIFYVDGSSLYKDRDVLYRAPSTAIGQVTHVPISRFSLV